MSPKQIYVHKVPAEWQEWTHTKLHGLVQSNRSPFHVPQQRPGEKCCAWKHEWNIDSRDELI